MTTLYRPTTPSAAYARSLFGGEDVCVAAGLAVHGAGPHPQFDENVWDFTGVIGLPRYLARHARILSSSRFSIPGGGHWQRSSSSPGSRRTTLLCGNLPMPTGRRC